MLVTLTLNAVALIRKNTDGISLDDMVAHFRDNFPESEVTHELCNHDASMLLSILGHASYFIEKKSDGKYYFKEERTGVPTDVVDAIVEYKLGSQ